MHVGSFLESRKLVRFCFVFRIRFFSVVFFYQTGGQSVSDEPRNTLFQQAMSGKSCQNLRKKLHALVFVYVLQLGGCDSTGYVLNSKQMF